jgi:hypothetical protein
MLPAALLVLTLASSMLVPLDNFGRSVGRPDAILKILNGFTSDNSQIGISTELRSGRLPARIPIPYLIRLKG